MAIYRCTVCGYEYDEAKEPKTWEQLPADWVCPLCGVDKSAFTRVDVPGSTATQPAAAGKSTDDLETWMADILKIAETGASIIEPMRTKLPVPSWDDLLIKGAQLARLPLNREEPVNTQTIIGPRAKQPLVIETPIYISHMSFGALSCETHVALARGSAAVHTAMCSGEGGILPESLEHSYRFIYEYPPNKYSATPENLRRVSAIEVKIGQSSKPGMGGHLPGSKVTPEIAAVRGFPQGQDIISPAHFPDIANAGDLKRTVDYLRDASDGKPIGIKLAAGHLEEDLAIALSAGPDFITLDGRPGSTGASPRFVKAATSLPTVFALYRARRYFCEHTVEGVSLVITGGLRVSSDFAKALALGADAVAIATAAMIACGCRQYRICHTGQCPVGIATQDPELRKRLDIDRAARGVGNFLRVSTDELKDFARLTGHADVHDLSIRDLCTTNSEISGHTTIPHV